MYNSNEGTDKHIEDKLYKQWSRNWGGGGGSGLPNNATGGANTLAT